MRMTTGARPPVIHRPASILGGDADVPKSRGSHTDRPATDANALPSAVPLWYLARLARSFAHHRALGDRLTVGQRTLTPPV